MRLGPVRLPRGRRAGSLGFALALAQLVAAGCGGRTPTGTGPAARVGLSVQFARGVPGPVANAIPTGVDSMEFSSFADVGGREQLVSSRAFRVTAATTEIVLDLRVPVATRYRIVGDALGIRDRGPFPSPAAATGERGPGTLGGNPTLYGIQFYASRRLDAGLGPAASLELVMADAVPRGVRFQGQTGDSLHWAPVPDARSYRVRAFYYTGAPSIDYVTSDTLLFLPYVQAGNYYRVRSELDNNLTSAFSETF